MNDFDDLSIPADESMRPQAKRSSPVAWTMVVIVLLIAGGGAFIFQKQLEATRADAEGARQAARDVSATLRKTEAAKLDLEAQLQKLQAQDQGLAAERDSLSQSVQEKEAELEQLKGTYKDLEDKLQSEIKKGDIHLTQSNGKIRVDLVDKVLFDSGQATLSTRGAEVLSRVGNVLSQVSDRQIQVSGHTDDSPISEKLTAAFPTNWELSVARAVNVVRYLTEKGGVPARRLVAAGYGQYDPVSSNNTPQGRARNRRIEILLMPPLAPQKTSGLEAASAKPPAKKVAVAVAKKGAEKPAPASAKHPKHK